MLVKVTQRHINRGFKTRGEFGGVDSGTCPVALALKSVVKRNIQVQVGTNNVAFFANGGYREYKLNKKAQGFVADYDNKESAKPTTLSIRVPADLVK